MADQQGGTDWDVTARISKARAAFVILKNIWASGGISMRTKLRINSALRMWDMADITDDAKKRFRHSSTPVWGASTKTIGSRRSEMKICGSEQDRNLWPSRYCGGSGAGSDTPSQHPALLTKPWSGTRRGRGRVAGLTTVGGETLKQSWSNKGPTGQEWPEQPRTECDGEVSLMAYAPPGAIGISNTNTNTHKNTQTHTLLYN